MKDIIIFDVDGTLVESSKTILPAHAEILNKLKEKYTLAICGGGTKEKIFKQDSSVKGFNIGTNAGKSAGQSIMHCHIHLIPRRDGDVENPQGGVRSVIPKNQHYKRKI